MQATAATRSAPLTTPIRRMKGRPLLGNLLEFRRDRLGLQRRLYVECGDFGSCRVGPITVYAVTSAELAEEVLVARSADFKKSKGLQIARGLLGDGLLTSEGDQHKRQRRLLAPAFAHKRIFAYGDTMAALADAAQAGWTDGATLSVADEMMKLTLAIAGRTLFDADVSGDARGVAEALPVAMRWVMEEVLRPVHFPIGWPTRRNRALRGAVAELDRIVYRLIAERRGDGHDHGDVLSMLLAARDEDGSGMDDRAVRDEVMTLLLAGHETTANALSWAFHLLGQNPSIAARLAEESDRVLAGRTPRTEELPQLPYALQVFKETLRLYPPAYLVGREALRPVRIGGQELPAGATIFVNIHQMHRRPDYFADPERFDPDRFAPEAEKLLPRGAFVPFGGGPRICIGNHFALMEGQIVLAALAQRVRFTGGAPSVTPEPLITLRPQGGLPMRVERRA